MRILVLQTAFLGDAVLTTPLFATIKKNIPDAVISCIIRPEWKPVLEHSKHVDELLCFDKRGKDSGPAGTLRFALELRKKKYDVALCPHPSFRSGLILRVANIPKRIGFDDAAGHMFFNHLVKRNEKQHEVQKVLSLCSLIGIDPENWVETLHVSPDPTIDVDALVGPLGIGSDEVVVGVHPGSVWGTKRWIPEKFAKVCRVVAKQGFKVVVFGTKQERQLVKEVVSNAEHQAVIPCFGLSLNELISVYDKKVGVYISNDSGPMHIACALGKPVVAIFGSTVPEQGYAPVSEMSAVAQVDRLKCRPCGPHGHDQCPEGHFDCMKKLEPHTVLLALRVLMGGFADTGFAQVLFNQQEGI